MKKIFKNIIAILSFFLFLAIGLNIYIKRNNIKTESIRIANNYVESSITVENSENINNSYMQKESFKSEELENDIENKVIQIKNTYDDNGLLDISEYKENLTLDDQDELIIDEYEKYVDDIRTKKHSLYYKDNIDFVNSLYDKICFVGDSNVLKIKRLKYLPKNNIFPFGAEMLKAIIKKADDYKYIDVRNFDYAVIWIGYNIKYIENKEHFINEYNRLIEKLKKQNPNIKVYVCSLLPATKEKIDEDIANGAIHNFYKGVEYDAKLSEYFNENYINTKVFIKDNTDYTSDGFHMQTTFYDRMIPYVGFYINFMEIKGKHNGI